MEEADTIVYDALVSTEILSLIPDEKEMIDVGKRQGNHPVPQKEINQILLEKAMEGKKVLRLKGGDPFVFGRGGEEAEVLAEHGILFEVVPGVTSAAAVPVASLSSSLPSAVSSLLSLSCLASDFCVSSVFCAHHPLTGCCNSMTPASRAAIIFFFICMSIPYNITSKTIGTTIASTSITAIIPATICLLFFFHIFIFHSPLHAPVPGNNRIDFPGCLIFR